MFEYLINSKFLMFILIASTGITAGAFLEVLEFTLDILFSSYNQKGLIDTDFDLIFNIIGASLAGFSVIIEKKIRNLFT